MATYKVTNLVVKSLKTEYSTDELPMLDVRYKIERVGSDWGIWLSWYADMHVLDQQGNEIAAQRNSFRGLSSPIQDVGADGKNIIELTKQAVGSYSGVITVTAGG